MVGMRDVAKRAGVSVSSVSLVINGTGYVSRDMREKVEQAMRDFDYAASGYRLDLTPGRVFYFYHDCTRFFKYVRPVCRA